MRLGRCRARRETADIGVMSAAANKKRIDFPSLSKTGVITVMSGRCVPPLKGLLSAITSPGRNVAPRRRSTVRTLSPIAPRWTGTCGALATRFPSASKIAQEKSSRSLMLTLRDVFWRTLPACSAIFMKMLLNNSSSTGSAWGGLCIRIGGFRARLVAPQLDIVVFRDQQSNPVRRRLSPRIRESALGL